MQPAMDDVQRIKNTYEKMSEEQLAQLVSNPGDLRLDIIPILQKELLNRGMNEEALNLSEYLVTKNKKRFDGLSFEELKQLIQNRLDSGESIESIKLDLKDDGINIFDILNENNKKQENVFDLITDLKQKGLEEHEIDEKLKNTLGIEKEESVLLKVQLRKTGKRNLIIGYTLLTTMTLLIVTLIGLGARTPISLFLFLGLGIWMISRGYAQTKE